MEGIYEVNGEVVTTPGKLYGSGELNL